MPPDQSLGVIDARREDAHPYFAIVSGWRRKIDHPNAFRASILSQLNDPIDGVGHFAAPFRGAP
jgi:hypothetical protein